MGFNLGRWFKYAQAKLDQSVRDDHAELDRLEAEREVELAERPWLGSTEEVPSFDQAKARIEWEAEHQRATADAPPKPVPSPDPIAEASAGPDAAAARLELDRRAREADDRLAAIRKELGVEPPAGPDQP